MLDFVLLFYIFQKQFFTIFLVAVFAEFPCDKRMDMFVDSFLYIMKIVWKNLFVAVNAHCGELRMSGDQAGS